MQIVPRPYQLESRNKAVPALKKTGKALIVLATGLGKTIASALIAQALDKLPGIFLVHNNDILERAIGEFQKVFNGANIRYALYNGHSKDIAGADIVFASFQTMGRNLKRFKRNQFKWMIVDEGHHAHAETYREVIEHFDCAKLGVTATPDRSDMQDIREIFGNEVINVSLEEAIGRGWLPRIEYHIVTDDGLDEKKLKQLAKEVMEDGERISLEEINRRVFIRARDEKIASIIEGYTEKTVIFCRNVRHAENFRKVVAHAETYHSDNTRDQNRQTLSDLRNGFTRRVIAVNSFNEGIDVPDIGLAVFNRATDSETIFRQQLGRGLRPGKEKLIVLDFVGNAERIQRLKQMTERIIEFHEKFTSPEERSREGYAKDVFHITGKGFEFTFSDTIVDIMKLIDRVNVEFYPTWREASRIAQGLGIGSRSAYKQNYKADRKLYANPEQMYGDFPGYAKFLGTNNRNHIDRKKEFYSTWQKASRAAKKLGVEGWKDYIRKYRKDPHLPSMPVSYYEDFPGWEVFCGRPPVKSRKRFYPTWKKAGKSAIKLGVTTCKDYQRKRRKDPMLPSMPDYFYSDFPGWPKFLNKEFYPSWKEASEAAIRLGITSSHNYKTCTRVIKN